MNMKKEEIIIKRHPVFKDYAADEEGNVYSLKFGKIKQMCLAPHGRGYKQIGLTTSGKTKMYLVHRFVYECFTERLIGGDWQCHHMDHNKWNNSLENLQLVDQIMNMDYGKKAGVLYGAANPNHPFYR